MVNARDGTSLRTAHPGMLEPTAGGRYWA